MKTTKEWIDQWNWKTATDEQLNYQLTRIQMDAYRAGMEQAADTARKHNGLAISELIAKAIRADCDRIMARESGKLEAP